MELMNIANFSQIAELADKHEIEKVGWFDFCSYVSDVWFKGDLTWDQNVAIKDWAWEVKDHPLAEVVFGTIVYAHKNNNFVY